MKTQRQALSSGDFVYDCEVSFLAMKQAQFNGC